jgi:hypothetical protein
MKQKHETTWKDDIKDMTKATIVGVVYGFLLSLL